MSFDRTEPAIAWKQHQHTDRTVVPILKHFLSIALSPSGTLRENPFTPLPLHRLLNQIAKLTHAVQSNGLFLWLVP